MSVALMLADRVGQTVRFPLPTSPTAFVAAKVPDRVAPMPLLEVTVHEIDMARHEALATFRYGPYSSFPIRFSLVLGDVMRGPKDFAAFGLQMIRKHQATTTRLERFLEDLEDGYWP